MRLGSLNVTVRSVNETETKLNANFLASTNLPVKMHGMVVYLLPADGVYQLAILKKTSLSTLHVDAYHPQC